jgi:hypothetical protein
MIDGWTNETQLPNEIERLLRDTLTVAQAAAATIQRVIASQNLDINALDTAFGHMACAAANLEDATNMARQVKVDNKHEWWNR